MGMRLHFSRRLRVANYKRDNRVVYVSNNFTFFGFIFAWGWLLSRRLWIKGLFVLLLYIPVYFFHSIVIASLMDEKKLPELYLFIPTLLLFLIHFYVGIKGNQWLKTSLVRKGYESY